MAKFVVNTAWLNVRTQPNRDSNSILQIPEGTIVEKLEEQDTWYRIRILNLNGSTTGQVEGWVNSIYLETYSQPTEPFNIDSNLKERESPLTADLIDEFFAEKQSHLKGIGSGTMEASRKYRINPTYIISHAILETGWGNSSIYLDKNNLFGWGAADSDPYVGAKKFDTREECIDYVMDKVNDLYLSPGGRYFEKKPCPGNNSYGMNVHYASDPEWGAKIAKLARNIESWASSRVDGWTLDIMGQPDAKRILDAVEKVNPEQSYYKARDITGDGRAETFCNWFIGDVLDVLSVQIPRYDSSAGYYPRPHPLYGNDLKTKPHSADSLNKYFNRGGDGKWKEINRSSAVALANQGKVVVASIPGSPGHIALVIPGGFGSEVRIAQAGRISDKDISLEEGFGNRTVEFFSYVN
jgi:hypothetical protein